MIAHEISPELRTRLTTMSAQSPSLFWFRRDLRLTDNHGLLEALSNSASVLPIFIFDRSILDDCSNQADARVSFIHQQLTRLNKELQACGSSLLVLYGTPLACLQELVSIVQPKALYTNHDYEPYAISRDAEVAKWLKSTGVEFHSFKDQVMCEYDEVLKADGTPYTVFTPYSKVWRKLVQEDAIPHYPSEKYAHKYVECSSLPMPSLSDIGFEQSRIHIPEWKADVELIRHYAETRNIPALATSGVGIVLRFGTHSVREIVRTAFQHNDAWLNELIWREFFMSILRHYPRVVQSCFKTQYEAIPWRDDDEGFERWSKGETGYDIVDAGMRQLNSTGWMHNRVRMIVASFLCKHLLIDWRRGEAYFAEKLIDFELSSNNGNWQWSAGCGCDAAPYFRVFNPDEQTRKFDPEGRYLRQWLSVDEIGMRPRIVEHAAARQRALDVYKKALEQSRGTERPS